MVQLNERGDIDAAALAVYSLVGLAILSLFYRGVRGTGEALASLGLYVILKLVGSAMVIAAQEKMDASLSTPAAILSTVVLAPLLSAAHGMVRVVVGDGQLSQVSRLNHIVILLSLILGIVGGINAFSATSTCHTDSNCSALSLLRAAAGLSVAAWAITTLTLIWFSTSKVSRSRASTAFLLIPLIFLSARLVYTVGVAATIDVTTRTQVFNPLTGSWILYLCVAWLPELGATISLLIAAFLESDQ